MIEICGTFDGYEGERGHRWGKFVHEASDEKLFFHRRLFETDDSRLKCLMEEIALIKQLTHPNIHAPLELFKSANKAEVFVYSRLQEYGSVNRILSTFYSYGLPETIIQNIICQILPAVCYIHERGIIHRCINTKDILLRADGTVLLSGFEHSIQLKHCNRWIGVDDRIHDFDESLQNVFAWLAPEVLKQDLNGYGQSCDVYSIGITICEMGNGFPPFTDMEPLQMLYEKIRGSTPFLIDSVSYDVIQGSQIVQSYKKPTFSSEIHDVVSKCLVYDANERPTAAALLEHKLFEVANNKNTSYLKENLCEILLSKIVALSLK